MEINTFENKKIQSKIVNDQYENQESCKIQLFLFKNIYNYFLERTIKMKLEKKNTLLATNFYFDKLSQKGFTSLFVYNHFIKVQRKAFFENKILKFKKKIFDGFKIMKIMSLNKICKSDNVFKYFKDNLMRNINAKIFFFNIKIRVRKNKKINIKNQIVVKIISTNAIVRYYNLVTKNLILNKTIENFKEIVFKNQIILIFTHLVNYAYFKIGKKRKEINLMSKAYKFYSDNLKKKIFKLIVNNFHNYLKIKSLFFRKKIIFSMLSKATFISKLHNNKFTRKLNSLKKIRMKKLLIKGLKEELICKKINCVNNFKKKIKAFNFLKDNLILNKKTRINATFYIRDCLEKILNNFLFLLAKNSINKLIQLKKFKTKEEKIQGFIFLRNLKMKNIIFNLLQSNIVINILRNRFMRTNLNLFFNNVKLKISSTRVKNNRKLNLMFLLEKKKSKIKKVMFDQMKNSYTEFENKTIASSRYRNCILKMKIFFILKHLLDNSIKLIENAYDYYNFTLKKKIFFVFIEYSKVVARENIILRKVKIFSQNRNLSLIKKFIVIWKQVHLVDQFIKSKNLKLKAKVFYVLLYSLNKS